MTCLLCQNHPKPTQNELKSKEKQEKTLEKLEFKVILASLLASSELRMLLADLEERRLEEPEHYADEAPKRDVLELFFGDILSIFKRVWRFFGPETGPPTALGVRGALLFPGAAARGSREAARGAAESGEAGAAGVERRLGGKISRLFMALGLVFGRFWMRLAVLRHVSVCCQAGARQVERRGLGHGLRFPGHLRWGEAAAMLGRLAEG